MATSLEKSPTLRKNNQLTYVLKQTVKINEPFSPSDHTYRNKKLYIFVLQNCSNYTPKYYIPKYNMIKKCVIFFRSIQCNFFSRIYQE